MRKYLTILSILICSTSFAQVKVIKVIGQQGIYGLANNATGDSLIYYSNNVRHAIPGGTPIDTVSTITALINTATATRYVYVSDSLRGGIFSLVNAPLTPDSGTIFRANGIGAGYYWVRSYTGNTVHVTWFGAVPDGVTDCTKPIQWAINSVDANQGHKGGIVDFTGGTYIISAPIILGEYVTLQGVFWGTFIVLAPNSNCDMFTNPTNAPINYFSIRDMTLLGNGNNQTKGNGIAVYANGFNNSDMYFFHLLIAHTKENGIYLESGWQYHVESCVIEYQGKYNVYLSPTVQSDPAAASSDLRRVFIENSSLLASTLGAIYANGSSKRWLLGLNINNNHLGNATSNSPITRISGVRNFVFSSNNITGNPTDTTVDLLRIDSLARNGVISGNIFNPTSEYFQDVGLRARYGISVLDTCNNITIKNNHFYNLKQDINISPTAWKISTDTTINDSLMALKQHLITLTTNAGSNPTFNQATGALNIPPYATSSGGAGISRVVAGYGQVQVNDSTTAVDTTVIVSKALANAVYATIASMNLKANDNAVVHLAGTETITGQKTFSNGLYVSGSGAYDAAGAARFDVLNTVYGTTWYTQVGNTGVWQLANGQNTKVLINSSANGEVDFYTGTGNVVFNGTGSLIANSFKKVGGTSSQFLKADGSVDANTYLPTTGNAASATKLQTARTIGITGDITWTSPAFDGSSNVTSTATLPIVNSNIGTFNNVTINAKGQAIAGTNVAYEPAFTHNTGFNLPLSTSLTDSSNNDIISSGQLKRDSIRADHISGTIPATKLPSDTLNFRRPYLRYDSASKTVWFDSSQVSSGGSSHTFQSGTYKPTVISSTNVGVGVGGTDQRMFYSRMDSIVAVSGYFTISPTSNASSFVTLSLPIASNFTQLSDLAGSVGGGSTSPFSSGLVTADTSNKGISIVVGASGTGSRTVTFTCQYIIK